LLVLIDGRDARNRSGRSELQNVFNVVDGFRKATLERLFLTP
jgi:hypothetical protein